METNQKPLLENLRKNGKGLVPFIKPAEDLLLRKDFDGNSWFVIGHFEAEGHKLNFLFHLMTIPLKDQPPVLNSVFSVTDETTGWHYGENKICPLSDAEISETGFSIKAPNGLMSGGFDRMHVQAAMPCGKVDVTMSAVGHALYNGGAGCVRMFGVDVYQYSIPTLVTTGTITIEDKTYEVNGTSWFDRQWQNHLKHSQENTDGWGVSGHWSWMDLNLDNGDKLSLWCVVDDLTGSENAWATILHPDGSQTVAVVEPLSVGASDYWLSTESGQKYPTHWMVKIPALDACLEVTPSPREQEIVSEYEFYRKYEGASSVRGTYKGKEATGYCYVELVGPWK